MIDAALQVSPYDKWGEESIWKQRARTTEANEYANVLTRYFSNPQTIPSFFNPFSTLLPNFLDSPRIAKLSLGSLYLFWDGRKKDIFYLWFSRDKKYLHSTSRYRGTIPYIRDISLPSRFRFSIVYLRSVADATPMKLYYITLPNNLNKKRRNS